MFVTKKRLKNKSVSEGIWVDVYIQMKTYVWWKKANLLNSTPSNLKFENKENVSEINLKCREKCVVFFVVVLYWLVIDQFVSMFNFHFVFRDSKLKIRLFLSRFICGLLASLVQFYGVFLRHMLHFKGKMGLQFFTSSSGQSFFYGCIFMAHRKQFYSETIEFSLILEANVKDHIKRTHIQFIIISEWIYSNWSFCELFWFRALAQGVFESKPFQLFRFYDGFPFPFGIYCDIWYLWFIHSRLMNTKRFGTEPE